MLESGNAPSGGLDDEKRDGRGKREGLHGLTSESAHVVSPPSGWLVIRSTAIVIPHHAGVCRDAGGASVTVATEDRADGRAMTQLAVRREHGIQLRRRRRRRPARDAVLRD